MNRTFPENFVWGAATASYQIEGAVREGGRGPSVWDAMVQTPGKILNGDTGDVACDHYHRIEEDVLLMKELGLQAYRFSIAWPRIQPDGKGDSNSEGIAFYNRLIDCLLEHGIEPWVTLYHWDLPLALQIEHDGWLNKEIVERFCVYARICFESFGDRVKNWVTLNEPWCSSFLGHGIGLHAPGRIDDDEPYIVAHHLLLSHAKAVEIYRREFAAQNGQIGLVNNCDFRFPLTDSNADKAAAERSLEFSLGWFADPVWKGDYPVSMRERLGGRLPEFTEAERTMILGSSDFFGLNHYTTMLAAEPEEAPVINSESRVYEDQHVLLTVDPDWQQTQMSWSIVPEGCRELLKWIDARYGHPPIYITENGCALDEPDTPTAVDDADRQDFLASYLRECRNAIEQGVDLRGYFVWSLMDNFEWAFGYERRFGIWRVDPETLERIPKNSARWYRETIEANGENIEERAGEQHD
jgi:beta-galactosidase